MTCRRGFSLVELLVVIGIIALLLGLLLPAVQSARESARQVQCLNTVRQWGLAMQQYETNRKRFPPGSISYGNTSVDPSRDRRTFVISLWPFLEAQTVLGSYDLQKPFWDPANRTAIDARVPVYYCPSDRAGAWRANQYPHARGNYVCNWGNANFFQTEPQYRKAPFSDYKLNNPTYAQAESRLEPGNAAAAFRDGLSNTIFMAETVMAAADTDNDVRGSIVNNTAGGPSFMTKSTPNAGADTCICQGTRSATYPGPCNDRGDGDGWNSARSLHRSGVSTGLGDGSTRFVSDAIDLAVWQAYGTIQAGEPAEALP
jgi:prepilin-type N-terminal cleavage/methylation domain-containing protein